MSGARLPCSKIWRAATSRTISNTACRPAPQATLWRNPLSRQFVRRKSQLPFGRGPRYEYSRFDDKQQRPSGPFGRIQDLYKRYPGAFLGVGVLFGSVYVYGLETVEISGRRRFNIISPQLEEKIMSGQYESTLQQLQGRLLPENHPYTQLCHRVVSRLIEANGLSNMNWIVHVVDDDEPNAFVMPGGQIFVFTGIIPIAKDEDGLAAILGHEISHKLARHVAEQMSGRLWAIVFVAAAALLGDLSSDFSSNIYNLFFTLRNSRTAEAEADHLGLLMMAKSCYDPNAAISIWQRMREYEAKRGTPPEFFSTHPASTNRMEHIKALLPEANKVASESHCSGTRGFFDDFKNTIEMSMTRDGARVGQPQNVPVTYGGKPNDGDDGDWF